MNRLRIYWLAVLALHRARRRRKSFVAFGKPRIGSHRRKALLKLGGRCACCNIGMEFAGALEIHHVNFNGDLNRQIMKALDMGIVTWVLECTKPKEGLFAVEVLCSVCHRMTHLRGKCPHRKEVRRAA